jgi:hypothetical protein
LSDKNFFDQTVQRSISINDEVYSKEQAEQIFACSDIIINVIKIFSSDYMNNKILFNSQQL